MRLTSRNIVEVIKAVKDAGYRRFRLQQDDFLLELDSAGGGSDSGEAVAPVVAAPEETRGDDAGRQLKEPAPAPPKPASRDGLVPVQAPMSGTFYRAPEPGAPPFVEVGSVVAPSDVVCIIEVMKLFNSIRAGVAGDVAEICVENEAPIQASQAVIWIRPRT